MGLISKNRFSSKIKNTFDYLANVRDYDAKKDDILWQETGQRILVNEYKKILEIAIFVAFDRLEKQGKYTAEEVVALFVDKSLQEWPKTAKRLLEQKEK